MGLDFDNHLDATAPVQYYEQSFWRRESLKYAAPHLRMRKCARLVNEFTSASRLGHFDLLDVGCGTATLRQLLGQNITYYGIDIAIHQGSPRLKEVDIVKGPINFDGRRFDVAVAQGIFEYIGNRQEEKLAEIRELLSPGGVLFASYTNFGHRAARRYHAFNNVQPLPGFRHSLGNHFSTIRAYPVWYSWRQRQPSTKAVQYLCERNRFDFPLVGKRLAFEYLFACFK